MIDMTVAEYKDAEGFRSLGDVMDMDEQGYLFYRGRLDRMINTGYHVYPRKIEAILSEVPGVAHVLVREEPNRERGETVKPAIQAADLIQAAQSTVTARLRYKVPRSFFVVDRLPGEQM
jgi:acyl-coenzyme A synthetase/AMP-(fatty) acid ligase